jgi:hypothetical protein
MLQLMLKGGALDMLVSTEGLVIMVGVECMMRVVESEVVVVTVVSVEDVKLVMEDFSSSDCEPR